MANQNTAPTQARAPKKLLLAKLYTDAPVRTEPEEPQKILVAGLAEARPVKEYPDTFFGRAFKVLRGELSTLFKSSLFFILFTLPFIVLFAWFASYFEDLVLGGSFNFMGNVGIGFPGGGDSLDNSIARLIWEVKEPIILMLGAALILGSIGLAGNFYCAKRSYFQNYYSKTVKTFWYGVAKYWWQFLITVTVMVLVGCAMITALMYLLAQQTLGVADAGAYCAVVFSWIFGAPLMLLPMVTLSLICTYELSFFGAIKNAIVLIVNNPIMVAIVGIASAIPFLIMGVSGTVVGIVVYVVMALIGCNLYAQVFVAMANRGMTKCHIRKETTDRAELQKQRQLAKKSGHSDYVGAGGTAKKKQKKQQVRYQNPKKKKKK
ncbi:MAG: hypothetical protein NC037_01640 [Bacteroides sp.]|nr:hypothetical protein [Bacillota bacterium]MCM1393684.1 hypothetical protein [[Eubacterium] siraeum]MCM1455217.1 hypothetical protein [Bacteroides sp.]